MTRINDDLFDALFRTDTVKTLREPLLEAVERILDQPPADAAAAVNDIVAAIKEPLAALDQELLELNRSHQDAVAHVHGIYAERLEDTRRRRDTAEATAELLWRLTPTAERPATPEPAEHTYLGYRTVDSERIGPDDVVVDGDWLADTLRKQHPHWPLTSTDPDGIRETAKAAALDILLDDTNVDPAVYDRMFNLIWVAAQAAALPQEES